MWLYQSLLWPIKTKIIISSFKSKNKIFFFLSNKLKCNESKYSGQIQYYFFLWTVYYQSISTNIQFDSIMISVEVLRLRGRTNEKEANFSFIWWSISDVLTVFFFLFVTDIDVIIEFITRKNHSPTEKLVKTLMWSMTMTMMMML